MELFYTNALQTKALGCLIGHEYEEASNFHAKNNCISHSIHSARAHELISSFTKNTPPQNFSKIQSDVLPLWTEFYGKQEDLVQEISIYFFAILMIELSGLMLAVILELLLKAKAFS